MNCLNKCIEECDIFSVLEETIDALSPLAEEPVIEICFRKHRHLQDVVCRLKPFNSNAPEFIGMGDTYYEAMISLIESLNLYAKKMSMPPPPK